VKVVGANPGLVSLTPRRSFTGASTGQFTLVDLDTTVTPSVNRSRLVPFQGMIVNDGAVPKVFGFFLLPKMPQTGTPSTTLATSPTLSGKVVLGPIVP